MDIAVSAIISVVAVVVSIFVARKYGDVAGTKAAIAHEEEKAQKARVTALRALQANVELAQKIVHHNAGANTSTGIARMPVSAFETAFLSAEPLLDIGQRLFDTVSDYLSGAYLANSLVDTYLSSVNGPAGLPLAESFLDRAKAMCLALLEILEKLGLELKAELDRIDT